MLRLPEHLRFIRSASCVADVADYWKLLYVVGGDRFRAELARVAELLVSNGWHFELNRFAHASGKLPNQAYYEGYGSNSFSLLAKFDNLAESGIEPFLHLHPFNVSMEQKAPPDWSDVPKRFAFVIPAAAIFHRFSSESDLLVHADVSERRVIRHAGEQCFDPANDLTMLWEWLDANRDTSAAKAIDWFLQFVHDGPELPDAPPKHKPRSANPAGADWKKLERQLLRKDTSMKVEAVQYYASLPDPIENWQALAEVITNTSAPVAMRDQAVCLARAVGTESADEAKRYVVSLSVIMRNPDCNDERREELAHRLCRCVRYWNLGGRGDVADWLLTDDRLQNWETVIE